MGFEHRFLFLARCFCAFHHRRFNPQVYVDDLMNGSGKVIAWQQFGRLPGVCVYCGLNGRAGTFLFFVVKFISSQLSPCKRFSFTPV